MRKKFTLLFRSALVASIIGSLVIWYGFHEIAPFAILKRHHVHENITPEQVGLKGEKFSFQSEDSLRLQGYWLETDSAQAVVILLHGIGSCKEHFFGLGKKLNQWGYHAVVFDGRAHGESEGEFCTYGYYEKYDVKRLVQLIQKRYPNLKIGIWGNSLGGAIALQSLAIEPKLSFGIIESTFSSLHQVVFEYKKRFLKGFGIKFLSDYALKRAGEIASFPPHEVAPAQSAEKITQPVFLAHGDADLHINIRNAYRNYKALSSSQKQLEVIKGASHVNLWEFGGENYTQKIRGFLERYAK